MIDNSVALVIWGAAESAVTIMAASIPVLRTLFRDVKVTINRIYAPDQSNATKASKFDRSQNNTVTVSAGGSSRLEEETRESNEKAYVRESMGAIVQTMEIEVEYRKADNYSDTQESGETRNKEEV